MLIGFVYMDIKNIVFFLMEGPHPSVPSVKMTDALGSYTSNTKFQPFQFRSFYVGKKLLT